MGFREFAQKCPKFPQQAAVLGSHLPETPIEPSSIVTTWDFWMTEIQRTSDIYGILLDSSESHVLMLVNEIGTWSLPHVHIPDKRVWLPNVEVTCTGMRNLLMADVTVLRNVDAIYSENGSHIDLIYRLENHSLEWTTPPYSEWIALNDLKHLTFGRPEFRPTIEKELQETITNVIPELRPPWARVGWFDTASAWIREQITASDDAIVGTD